MSNIKLESIISAALAEVDEELGKNSRFVFSGADTESDCTRPHLMLRTYSEKLLENIIRNFRNFCKSRALISNPLL